MEKFKEIQARSIAKAMSWRVTISVSHLINGLIVTGSWLLSLQLVGLFAVVNTIMFWLHERLWNHFQWNRKHNDKIVFNEGQGRSVSKIITWRIFVTFSNFLVPFITTGSWQSGLAFLTIATVVNMITFWAHERAWNRITWGKREYESV
jgi:uncharacterized membrane protein